MKTPAYISRIQSGRICMEGSFAGQQARGLKVRRPVFGRPFIAYDETGPWMENRDLIGKLAAAVDAGMAFLDDPRQGWSPADVLRELAKNGLVRAPFSVICFSGQGAWTVRLERGGS